MAAWIPPLFLLSLLGLALLRAPRRGVPRARADLAALLGQALARRAYDPGLAGAVVSLQVARGRPPEIAVSGGSAHARLVLAAEIEALLGRVSGLADAAALSGPVRWRVRLGADGRLAP